MAISAHASDSAFRKSLDAQSRQSGTGMKPVPALNREEGNLSVKFGKLDGLIFVLTGHRLELERWRYDESGRYAWIDGWELDINPDGSQFRIGKPPRYTAELTGDKIPLGELKVLGKDFIDRQLARVIDIGAKDKIEFWGSGYYHAGGMGESGARLDVVMGHVAIFSRTVGGQAVLGPGSKIAMTFDANRRITGVSVDWPRYLESGQKQIPIMVEKVRDRARQAVGTEWVASLDTNLRRFECGYFDSGKPGTVVQIACALHHSGEYVGDSAPVVYGRVEFIPAAKTVIPPGWDWDAANIKYVDQPAKDKTRPPAVSGAPKNPPTVNTGGKAGDKNKTSPLNLDKDQPANSPRTNTPAGGTPEPGRSPDGTVR